MTHGFENAVEGLNDLLQKNPELEVPITTIIYSMCGLVSAYSDLKNRTALPVTGDDPYSVKQFPGEDMGPAGNSVGL